MRCRGRKAAFYMVLNSRAIIELDGEQESLLSLSYKSIVRLSLLVVHIAPLPYPLIMTKHHSTREESRFWTRRKLILFTLPPKARRGGRG